MSSWLLLSSLGEYRGVLYLPMAQTERQYIQIDGQLYPSSLPQLSMKLHNIVKA